MKRIDDKLEAIRLRIEFGVWLRQRANIRLSSEMGQHLLKHWLKGQCVQLTTKKPWVSVTIHV